VREIEVHCASMRRLTFSSDSLRSSPEVLGDVSGPGGLWSCRKGNSVSMRMRYDSLGGIAATTTSAKYCFGTSFYPPYKIAVQEVTRGVPRLEFSVWAMRTIDG
jgi:hypothetical protein